MKKMLFVVFCTFLVFFSCKNLTNDELLEKTEKESEVIVENNDDKKDIHGGDEQSENSKSEENEERGENGEKLPEGETVCIDIKLNFEQNDIDFEVEKNGTKLSLSCKGLYDDYEWYMGTQILSKRENCEIDFNGFEKNIYPIVLFARRNSIVYSSVYYANFLGIKFGEKSSRTVFPEMSNSHIRNIHLEIVDLNSSEVILKDFADYDSFISDKFDLYEGLYSVSVTAQIGNRIFCGNEEINVEKNQTEYSIQMDINSFETDDSEKGGLCISAYFMTKNLIVDSDYSLYQKKDEKFILYSMDKVVGGNLNLIDGENEYAGFKGIQFSLNDIDSGDYWLRINGITVDGKEKCYQVEYIYIDGNQKSEKIFEICDFFDMYTIDYDFGGGFFTGKNLTTKYSSFDSLSFPNEKEMIKPGYTFSGWYFDKELSEKADCFYGAGVFSSSLNLYAGWQKNEIDSDEVEISVLENSKILVNSMDKKIQISFPLEKKKAQEIKNNTDLLTVKLYDKKNVLIGFGIQNIDWKDGKVFFEMICDLKKNENYLVEINVYNPVVLSNGFKMNEIIFCDKQLIQKKDFV